MRCLKLCMHDDTCFGDLDKFKITDEFREKRLKLFFPCFECVAVERLLFVFDVLVLNCMMMRKK